MEWNLLLGGEHPNDERLGYTWLEFGRRADDGAAFCTIGCGLKAVTGRGIAAHWFFVTDQRVGEDLRLVDATGIALTRGPARGRDRRDAAASTVGHATTAAPSTSVCSGSAMQRYDALIDLLIQVRAAAAVQAPRRARPLRRAHRARCPRSTRR